ncbi:hypothetical protein A6F68_00802 [Tsuneonella dongtanensis]|uniref:Uncharacterized protein n=1 Tax=Tsuneonella dongtanensis TaxID=692370 RepID=A0A1B2AB74_9SPHN|nr:hypothetical protein A6F68_00802 [Tsuneonella dongtanensis]
MRGPAFSRFANRNRAPAAPVGGDETSAIPLETVEDGTPLSVACASARPSVPNTVSTSLQLPPASSMSSANRRGSVPRSVAEPKISLSLSSIAKASGALSLACSRKCGRPCVSTTAMIPPPAPEPRCASAAARGWSRPAPTPSSQPPNPPAPDAVSAATVIAIEPLPLAASSRLRSAAVRTSIVASPVVHLIQSPARRQSCRRFAHQSGPSQRREPFDFRSSTGTNCAFATDDIPNPPAASPARMGRRASLMPPIRLSFWPFAISLSRDLLTIHLPDAELWVDRGPV